MTGPQAESKTFNPVIEALDALEALESLKISDERDLLMYHAARALAWSLLASVTGGQTINLGSEPPPPGPNPLESLAKEAFGG